MELKYDHLNEAATQWLIARGYEPYVIDSSRGVLGGFAYVSFPDTRDGDNDAVEFRMKLL